MKEVEYDGSLVSDIKGINRGCQGIDFCVYLFRIDSVMSVCNFDTKVITKNRNAKYFVRNF